MSERPAVSLSMALHCKMEIWLSANAYPKEEPTSQAKRTFDFGHFVEAATLGRLTLAEGIETGPWFYDEKEILDHATGRKLTPENWEIQNRQLEVEFQGVRGHVDAFLQNRKEALLLLPDVKSTAGHGYDRALKGDLMASPFSREYVGQLHAYRAGAEKAGHKIDDMGLLYVNKEQSHMMFRFVEYRPEIVEEAIERLSWAKSIAEPEPDWKWSKGEEIQLRCGYCAFKYSCASVRGVELSLAFDKKGKPKWSQK